MALQLRRGSDSERIAITFAEGELVYTTDTKKIWIGDGTTAGGITVTAEGGTGGSVGFTGSQGPAGGFTGSVGFTGSQGIVGSVGFTGSQGPAGQTVQLDSNLNLNNFTINGTGNIDIIGSISTVSNVLPTSSVVGITTENLSIVGPLGGIRIVTEGNYTNNYSLFDIKGYSAGPEGFALNLTRSRGSAVSPAQLETNDEISNIIWYGADANGAPQFTAAISASVDSTVSGSIVPGKLTLFVTNSLGIPTPGLSIDSNQIVTFSDNTVAEGTVAGTVDVAGGVVTYLKIKVGNADYAMPLYAINV